MRCEKKIVVENFEKKKVRNNKKKWEENLGK
jgi:hypothetical protein